MTDVLIQKPENRQEKDMEIRIDENNRLTPLQLSAAHVNWIRRCWAVQETHVIQKVLSSNAHVMQLFKRGPIAQHLSCEFWAIQKGVENHIFCNNHVTVSLYTYWPIKEHDYSSNITWQWAVLGNRPSSLWVNLVSWSADVNIKAPTSWVCTYPTIKATSSSKRQDILKEYFLYVQLDISPNIHRLHIAHL